MFPAGNTLLTPFGVTFVNVSPTRAFTDADPPSLMSSSASSSAANLAASGPMCGSIRLVILRWLCAGAGILLSSFWHLGLEVEVARMAMQEMQRRYAVPCMRGIR